MDKLFDNHNHSEFSFDGGRTSVLKTSRQAAAKKLGGICFTDHCDFFRTADEGRARALRPGSFRYRSQKC